MHVENTRIHKKTTTAISIAKTYGSKVAPYLDALDISVFQQNKITWRTERIPWGLTRL